MSMIKVLLVLSIVIAVFGVDPTPSPDACKAYPNGLIADPANKYRFYLCNNGHLSGDVHECAKNSKTGEQLVFDESQQRCIDGGGVTCPAPDGVFVCPGDKHKFIRCKNGEGAVMSCGPVLIFSYKCKACGNEDDPCPGPVTKPLVTTVLTTHETTTSYLPSSSTTPKFLPTGSPDELDCTFETTSERANTCGLQVESRGCLISEVVSRGHGFKGNGPNIDHTLQTKSGWYLNFEVNQTCSNQHQNEDAQVKIVYPNLTFDKLTRCFNFWYQISGENAITLRTGVVLHRDGQRDDIVILNRINHNETKWTRSSVLLEAVADKFDIGFFIDFNLDHNSKGFVSIDDILLVENEECN